VSPRTPPGIPAGRPLAVVVARQGRLPLGADEAVSEAGGLAVVVGSGSQEAAGSLVAAGRSWWHETGDGFRPGALAAHLAPRLAHVPLVVVPASPDGRDLAPRLAAELDRPLLAQAHTVACRVGRGSATTVEAQLARLDDRVLVTVTADGPAVATLVPGVRTVTPAPRRGRPQPLADQGVDPPPTGGRPAGSDPELLELIEPDPATMDLADATRVLGGGAGLVAGRDDDAARGAFADLVAVAAALGASAGATRVATDAGWTGYERQIGTTGVSIHPDLYVAFGVSGASQHVGGLGSPRHVVSVNRDPSCPMTALADLGLVTDAGGLLQELARRLGVGGPDVAARAGGRS
jgi:electron transfer flavoprotein alpha subunit